jgi:hypothetical protein
MDDVLCERVRTFIDVEMTCGEIYEALADVYPDDRATWRYFATVEKNHSITALIALRFCRIGKLPEEFEEYLSGVEDTLRLAREIRKDVRANRSLPAGVAQRLMELEESACKAHFRQLMKLQTDSEVVSNLRKLLIDVDQHVEELRAFLESKGLLV